MVVQAMADPVAAVAVLEILAIPVALVIPAMLALLVLLLAPMGALQAPLAMQGIRLQ
jgi:hypothetical protein